MTDSEKKDRAKIGDVINLATKYPPSSVFMEWPVFYGNNVDRRYFERVSNQGWRRVK